MNQKLQQRTEELKKGRIPLQTMRAGKLHPSMRARADALYYNMLRERGMGRMRAGLRYLGLRLVGRWSAAPGGGPEYPKKIAK